MSENENGGRPADRPTAPHIRCTEPHISICPYPDCISRVNGRCLHDGLCEPCDRDGNLVQVFKTLADCAECRAVTKCDAHITGGTYRQCAPIIDSDEANRALKIVESLKPRRHWQIEEVPV
jgi:hypothetical protein